MFIVFMIFRLGAKGDTFWWGTMNTRDVNLDSGYKGTKYSSLVSYISCAERAENDLIFGSLTTTAYFFGIMVMMLGVLMGDNQMFTVGTFQGLLDDNYNVVLSFESHQDDEHHKAFLS